MVFPSEAEIHPACWNDCNSSSVHPPSGPMARVISLPAASGFQHIAEQSLLFDSARDNSQRLGRFNASESFMGGQLAEVRRGGIVLRPGGRCAANGQPVSPKQWRDANPYGARSAG